MESKDSQRQNDMKSRSQVLQEIIAKTNKEAARKETKHETLLGMKEDMKITNTDSHMDKRGSPSTRQSDEDTETEAKKAKTQP